MSRVHCTFAFSQEISEKIDDSAKMAEDAASADVVTRQKGIAADERNSVFDTPSVQKNLPRLN